MEHNLLSDYNDWDALSDRWSVVIFRHELCDVVRSPPSPLPSNSFHVDDNKNGINKFSDCLAPLSLSLPLFLAAVSLSLSLSVGGPTHTRILSSRSEVYILIMPVCGFVPHLIVYIVRVGFLCKIYDLFGALEVSLV